MQLPNREEVQKRMAALLMVLKSAKLTPEVRERLNADLRGAIAKMAIDQYKYYGLDDSQKFDLEVFLGDSEKVKQLTPAKLEAILEKLIKMYPRTDGTLDPALCELIDRPMLVAIEQRHTKLVDYLLRLSDQVYSRLRKANFLSPRLITQYAYVWEFRRPYYVQRAIELGRPEIAEMFLFDSEYGAMDDHADETQLHRLVEAAKARGYTKLAQKLLRMYVTRVEFLRSDGIRVDLVTPTL